MKSCPASLLAVFAAVSVFAQPPGRGSNNTSISAEHTYAVVIGIANYENENLNLNYANRDALSFAEYLRSDAGGRVPEENIRLLIDTNATTAAIYNSLKWVKTRTALTRIQDESARSLVYIYFSGHGDVETDTKASLGFLLAYNTPSNNYINNAVRIEDLNDYAHTLSVDLNANVVLITDACHSGKLAGSKNKGTYLVGKELSIAKEQEVRIASCNPDELSLEDERWGNGRGVFSWYLVNGLKGLADKNNDQTITLQEIKQYVESSISADPILKELNHKQSPVLTGKDAFLLAKVNESAKQLLMAALPVAAAPASPAAIFWEQLSLLEGLNTSSIYKELLTVPAADIPVEFINKVESQSNLVALQPAAAALRQSITTDREAARMFTDKMVEWLHGKGQTVINQYLEGDEAELEKRRYYNSGTNYLVYADMFALALRLVDKDDPLRRPLTINQLYLEGLAYRLQMPSVNFLEQKRLLEKAFALQRKAVTIDDNAPYLQNELGILYKEKEDIAHAIKCFTRATELAPSWSLPKANLCGMYAAQKKWDKAKEYGEAAESLQPGAHTTVVSLGALHEAKGNLLFAEEYYRQAIDINSRHYFPFERLGHLYYKITNYAWADSFFHEAALRKKGYYFRESPFLMQYVSPVAPPMGAGHCDVDTNVLLKDDIMAFFYVAYDAYRKQEYAIAERFYKKIIALDKNNPLVFHYAGKLQYDQQQREKAEVLFRMAADNFLQKTQFDHYCDSFVKHKKYPYDHSCVESFFRDHHYQDVEDHYFLANIYDQWKQYEQAEQRLRIIIQLYPPDIAGYVKYWQLLEKIDRYADAEQVIRSYARYDNEQVQRELNDFYRRCIDRFPGNADWYHRLGLLLYEKASLPARAAFLDSIVYFPKLNKELFLGVDEAENLHKSVYSLDANIKGIPSYTEMREIRQPAMKAFMPGINEEQKLAEPIYTPRKDAIYFLSKADSLVEEESIKADLRFKIGNVYEWSGSAKLAYPWYMQSVTLSPGNSSTRLRLIDVSKTIYKNKTGYGQLLYLYDSAMINYPKRMMLAEWSLQAGDFLRARKLLEEARQVYPYPIIEVDDLLGRSYLLASEPARAITYYKKYAASSAADAGTCYTLCRLYAQSNKQAEAWKWLEKAVAKGFHYPYILKDDVVLTSLRKSARWKQLMQGIEFKKYHEPKR